MTDLRLANAAPRFECARRRPEISRVRSTRPAKFSRSGLGVLLLLLFAVSFTGCDRSISPEEKKMRTELRQALRARAFAHALPLAQKITRLAPNDNGAWARLAQAQKGLRDLSALRQTLAQWQTAVKRPSPKYQEYRGDLAAYEGRTEDALRAWRDASAATSSAAGVARKIARLEEAHHHWPEAILAWTRALKTQPSASVFIQRALCYRRLHSWDAALADLRSAQALAPNDPVVRQKTALFARLGKFLAEVRELDQQLAVMPDDSGLFADQALLFLRAGDPELALEDAEKAALLSPESVRPQLFLALAGDVLHRPAPGHSLVRRPLRLEEFSAEFLETINRLDAQIAADPKNAELRTSRAWQLNEIAQPRLALADAEKAIAANPRSVGAYVEASYALAKLERAADAYDRIKRATELDPNFSTAWQYRGELEMKQNDYDNAIESLSRALAINQTATALEKREECYRRMGLLVKAEDDEKALQEIRATR